VDRGKPGLIAVLPNGKRFVNEADGYYQFTAAMIAAAPAGEEVTAWLICDHAFQRRYPFGMSKPFPFRYGLISGPDTSSAVRRSTNLRIGVASIPPD
jgi:hypothetical protein